MGRCHIEMNYRHRRAMPLDSERNTSPLIGQYPESFDQGDEKPLRF
jgi:hypothetical protein